ncbi:hypothetical protein FKM82_026752, partial [Ascaphus truei]
KRLEEKLKQFPSPEELSNMVGWDVLTEILVKQPVIKDSQTASTGPRRSQGPMASLRTTPSSQAVHGQLPTQDDALAGPAPASVPTQAAGSTHALSTQPGGPTYATLPTQAGVPSYTGLPTQAVAPTQGGVPSYTGVPTQAVAPTQAGVPS